MGLLLVLRFYKNSSTNHFWQWLWRVFFEGPPELFMHKDKSQTMFNECFFGKKNINWKWISVFVFVSFLSCNLLKLACYKTYTKTSTQVMVKKNMKRNGQQKTNELTNKQRSEKEERTHTNTLISSQINVFIRGLRFTTQRKHRQLLSTMQDLWLRGCRDMRSSCNWG